MVAVNYLWDPDEDNIVKELDDAGNTIADYTTEPYLYGDVISQYRDGQSRFLHHDAQGSTLAVTDDSQNVTDTFTYTAFGEVTERTGTTEVPFQYIGRQGYYTDSLTAQIMARRRPYDPARVRWLAPDPVDLVNITRPDPVLDTMSYQYSLNNPLTYVDPSGLSCEEMPCCCCADSITLDPKTSKVNKDPVFGSPGIGIEFTVNAKTVWERTLKDPTSTSNDCTLVWNERSTLGKRWTLEERKKYLEEVKKRFGIDIPLSEIRGQRAREWYNQLEELKYLKMFKPWRDRKKQCPSVEDTAITDTPGVWNVGSRETKTNIIQFELIIADASNCECPENKKSKVLYIEVFVQMKRGVGTADFTVLDSKPTRIPMKEYR